MIGRTKVDPSLVGLALPPVTVRAEPGQLQLFAKATGQTDPIFFEDAAARSAGYRSIVAPPTFVFALLSVARADPFDHFARLGFAVEETLHGSQAFEYGEPLCAGDTVRFEWSVADIWTRKQGALTFVHLKITATNQDEATVAKIDNVTIVLRR